MPLAPGRFSTTTLCANALPRCSARMRPIMSALPPGGHGTTMRMGLLGQVCGERWCRRLRIRWRERGTGERADDRSRSQQPMHVRLPQCAQPVARRLPWPIETRQLLRLPLTATNFVANIPAPARARQEANNAPPRSTKMRVVDAIAQWFEVAGFKHYFGYAGGAVWPFLDALTDKPQDRGHPGQARISCRAHGRSLPSRQRQDRAGDRVERARPAQRGGRLRQRHARSPRRS